MSKEKRRYEGRVWVGFDLGGTKMLAKVFNDDYQTLGRAKQKTCLLYTSPSPRD